jgi:7-carboxy-7-deazaguanine synthase
MASPGKALSAPALQVTELFRSLQGESTYQGLPCSFIRLTGCNLRCSYCDTPYSYEGGERRSIAQVTEKVQMSAERGSLVELTGGEPLLQEATIPLMEKLVAMGYRVLLETNGSRDISHVPPQVVKIVDIKCPGSGMGGSFHQENLRFLAPHDELKFVLSGRSDYEWACNFITDHALAGRTLLFSSVFGALNVRDLADWIVSDNLPVRLNMQLHKYIWGPGTQN